MFSFIGSGLQNPSRAHVQSGEGFHLQFSLNQYIVSLLSCFCFGFVLRLGFFLLQPDTGPVVATGIGGFGVGIFCVALWHMESTMWELTLLLRKIACPHTSLDISSVWSSLMCFLISGMLIQIASHLLHTSVFSVLCSLHSRCSFWVQMYLFMLSIHMLIQATVSGKVSLTNYTVRVSCVCPVFRYFDDILLSTSLDSLFLTSLHRLCFPWCW